MSTFINLEAVEHAAKLEQYSIIDALSPTHKQHQKAVKRTIEEYQEKGAQALDEVMSEEFGKELAEIFGVDESDFVEKTSCVEVESCLISQDLTRAGSSMVSLDDIVNFTNAIIALNYYSLAGEYAQIVRDAVEETTGVDPMSWPNDLEFKTDEN